METHENELAQRYPATQAYVDFGLEQVKAINARFRDWISQQSFVDDAAPSEFVHMVVSGHSDRDDFNDTIEWDLRFPEKTGKLGDSILHEQRFPVQTTFNSKPQFSSTVGYMQIRVSNGEKGWVKKGAFPQNVRVANDHDAIMRDPMKKHPKIGVQTDVRREALAGFEAAYHWQCYRAMAVTCCDYLREKLQREREELEESAKTMESFDGYEASQSMRDRKGITHRLFVESLPDIDAFPNTYRPGALEATLALEIEHAVQRNLGPTDYKGGRPIWYPKAKPIQISSNSSGFDALLQLEIGGFGSHGDKDEKVLPLLEKQLRKHFDVRIDSKRDMTAAFQFSYAHKIDAEIRGGSTDTLLHRRIHDFNDALRAVSAASKEWYGKDIPAQEADHQKRLDEARAERFSFDFRNP
jgi:hypothetical protein